LESPKVTSRMTSRKQESVVCRIIDEDLEVDYWLVVVQRGSRVQHPRCGLTARNQALPTSPPSTPPSLLSPAGTTNHGRFAGRPAGPDTGLICHLKGRLRAAEGPSRLRAPPPQLPKRGALYDDNSITAVMGVRLGKTFWPLALSTACGVRYFETRRFSPSWLSSMERVMTDTRHKF